MRKFKLVFLLDFLLHGFDEFFNFRSELLDFLFEAGHFLYFFEVIDVNNFLTESIEKMHFSMFFFSFIFILLFLLVFLDFEFFQESGLIFCFKLVIRLTDLSSSLFINKDIIEVPKIGKMGNQMILILRVSFTVLNGKRISIYI
jgi:hypothetical protein